MRTILFGQLPILLFAIVHTQGIQREYFITAAELAMILILKSNDGLNSSGTLTGSYNSNHIWKREQFC
jgi:hypothetical protein